MKKEGILYEKTFIEFNYRVGMPDGAFLHAGFRICCCRRAVRAYKAYYDFLKNETDNVGLPITDPADASPNYPYVNVWYTGKLLCHK